MRFDGRNPSQIRSVKITPNVLRHAEGSVDISFGHTRLICSASIETQLPKWLQNSGQGWVSAEYGMLPRSTHTRIQRDRAANSGRTQEISRLLGRSLRAAVDLRALGERQISIDCDVIQADGGTRTAAITGGFVAMALALEFLRSQSILPKLPLLHYVAAISVGLHQNQALLDLNYEEDAMCGVDMNFVMTDKSQLVEVQGTAESGTFSKEQMTQMMNLAETGCQTLFAEQEKILGAFFPLSR
jgi:ribonuclease PH